MPEENNAPQDQQAQTKSIDGVKPAPKLSGENQEHHLGTTNNETSAEPTEQTSAPEANPSNQNHSNNAPGNRSNFPVLAVSLAVIVFICLSGLVVLSQISQ